MQSLCNDGRSYVCIVSRLESQVWPSPLSAESLTDPLSTAKKTKQCTPSTLRRVTQFCKCISSEFQAPNFTRILCLLSAFDQWVLTVCWLTGQGRAGLRRDRALIGLASPIHPYWSDLTEGQEHRTSRWLTLIMTLPCPPMLLTPDQWRDQTSFLERRFYTFFVCTIIAERIPLCRYSAGEWSYICNTWSMEYWQTIAPHIAYGFDIPCTQHPFSLCTNVLTSPRKNPFANSPCFTC